MIVVAAAAVMSLPEMAESLPIEGEVEEAYLVLLVDQGLKEVVEVEGFSPLAYTGLVEVGAEEVTCSHRLKEGEVEEVVAWNQGEAVEGEEDSNRCSFLVFLW